MVLSYSYFQETRINALIVPIFFLFLTGKIGKLTYKSSWELNKNYCRRDKSKLTTSELSSFPEVNSIIGPRLTKQSLIFTSTDEKTHIVRLSRFYNPRILFLYLLKDPLLCLESFIPLHKRKFMDFGIVL